MYTVCDTQDLHSATSQKTAFFTVTAVKTSNLTFTFYLPKIWKRRSNANVINKMYNLLKHDGNRQWRPIGLWDVETPTFSRQSANSWRWGCQPYAPAARYPPGRFLVVISVRSWVDPTDTVRLEGLRKLKKIQWLHRDSNPQPSGL
jgi:hypothetical protein